MEKPSPTASGTDKVVLYRHIYSQLEQLIKAETDFLANAANTVALLKQTLTDVNWVGFYFVRDRELVLGPFQGIPGCTRIQFGTGVCGTAAVNQETIIVDDVSKFAGHIVCDVNSKSEMVVPLLNWGRLLGVLDIDSPVLNRFDEDDREGVESLVSLFLTSLSTDDLPDFEALARNATV
jgi:GAF domain-containing protein